MNNLNVRALIFLFTFIIFLLLPIISANPHAFYDDFRTDPDSANSGWEVQNAEGITFNNPGLTLTSVDRGNFPYIKTSDDNDLSSDRLTRPPYIRQSV